VRAGTLAETKHLAAKDRASPVVPDVHIFTRNKMLWTRLPEDTKVFEEFYDVETVWSKESLERRKVLRPQVERWQSERGRWEEEDKDEAAGGIEVLQENMSKLDVGEETLKKKKGGGIFS
jgi:hypothetical protein